MDAAQFVEVKNHLNHKRLLHVVRIDEIVSNATDCSHVADLRSDHLIRGWNIGFRHVACHSDEP
jgi:hypothetical protein